MPSEKETSSAPQKPSLLRQLIPWVFAAGILAFMFYKVDFIRVWEVMKQARASWIITAYLTYCAVYYFTDILSFWRAYNWFNTDISFPETARLRFASYIVQAVNGALTEIMSVLYMYRVKKVPVLQSTSSAGFIYFNETMTLIALLSYCAFFLPADGRVMDPVPVLGVPFWTMFQLLLIIAWVLSAAWIIFWRTGLCHRVPRIRDAGVLVAFKKATLPDYAEVFLYRFANNLISVFMNVIILRALGIDAPMALLFAAVPVMVNVAYWPVSAGGFGGTQAAAVILLAGYITREEAFAYSLIWSALFLLTRTLTGALFVQPVYRAAFNDGKSAGNA